MSKLDTSFKPVFDRLYEAFNDPDSAVDPIQIVRRYDRLEDREIVAFVAGPGVRARGVGDGVGRGGLPRDGGRPASSFGRSNQSATAPPSGRSSTDGPRTTTSSRCSGSFGGCSRNSARSSGPLRRDWCRRSRCRSSARVVFGARTAGRPASGLRPRSQESGRVLFLRPAVHGSGLQAPQPVSPLDGAPGRRRSRRLDDGRPHASSSCRSTRTRFASAGCLRLTRRRRLRAGGWRSTSPSALRVLDPDDPVRYDFALLPPQHDGRVRLRHEAGDTAVSASRLLPALWPKALGPGHRHRRWTAHLAKQHPATRLRPSAIAYGLRQRLHTPRPSAAPSARR